VWFLKKLCSLWQPTLLPSRIASAERGGGWSARKTRRKVFVGKIVLATCGASRLNAQSTNAHSRPWHAEYSTTPPPSHDSNLWRHLTSQALHYRAPLALDRTAREKPLAARESESSSNKRAYVHTWQMCSTKYVSTLPLYG